MYFKSASAQRYGANYVTVILIRGSVIVVAFLTFLLIIHDLLYEPSLRPRILIGLAVIALLLFALKLAKLKHTKIANWMLIGQYELLAATVLLYWGLESMVGILTASFAILLPSILMTPRHILAVVFITFGIVIVTFLLHTYQIISPVPHTAKQSSSVLDVIAYCTILAVFALVSWVSSHQSTRSLNRALEAEDIIRRQKDSLAIELEKESSRLRQAQLQQIQQLHKFAIIGQSAMTTLHELSNHLSVLNLDIDDLKQYHKHSQALVNAEESIGYINNMVKNVRAQLDSRNVNRLFYVKPTLNKIADDMKHKFEDNSTVLKKRLSPTVKSVKIRGDSTSLMQIVSILLCNALDACCKKGNGRVTLSAEASHTRLIITVSDNGPGIDLKVLPTLFQPSQSQKSTGLGIGLYLAKHLVESQYNGKLELINSNVGAHFQVSIPIAR